MEMYSLQFMLLSKGINACVALPVKQNKGREAGRNAAIRKAQAGRLALLEYMARLEKPTRQVEIWRGFGGSEEGVRLKLLHLQRDGFVIQIDRWGPWKITKSGEKRLQETECQTSKNESDIRCGSIGRRPSHNMI